MPALSFDAFSKQIRRGEIPPAVYLFGDEDVLKEEAVRAVLDRVVAAGLRDFNLDQRSASELGPEAIETLCNTLPMMSDRRLVVIREVEAWSKRAGGKSAVLRYLEKPAPETVLVLVQGAPRREDDRHQADPDLARLTAAVQVDRYPPKLAQKWVQKRAEERGIALAPEAVEHLIRAVDGDLGAARSELDKLAGLAGAEPVTLQQLTASLGIRHGETPSDWWAAVIEDRTAQAAVMLPHLLGQPGISGVSLLAQLGTHLVGLGLARAQFDKGLRGGSLERTIFSTLMRLRPPYRLEYRGAAALWSRLAEPWPKVRVAAAIAAARRADARLKGTTLADERGILVDLIMELSPMAGAAA